MTYNTYIIGSDIQQRRVEVLVHKHIFDLRKPAPTPLRIFQHYRHLKYKLLFHINNNNLKLNDVQTLVSIKVFWEM